MPGRPASPLPRSARRRRVGRDHGPARAPGRRSSVTRVTAARARSPEARAADRPGGGRLRSQKCGGEAPSRCTRSRGARARTRLGVVLDDREASGDERGGLPVGAEPRRRCPAGGGVEHPVVSSLVGAERATGPPGQASSAKMSSQLVEVERRRGSRGRRVQSEVPARSRRRRCCDSRGRSGRAPDARGTRSTGRHGETRARAARSRRPGREVRSWWLGCRRRDTPRPRRRRRRTRDHRARRTSAPPSASSRCAGPGRESVQSPMTGSCYPVRTEVKTRPSPRSRRRRRRRAQQVTGPCVDGPHPDQCPAAVLGPSVVATSTTSARGTRGSRAVPERDSMRPGAVAAGRSRRRTRLATELTCGRRARPPVMPTRRDVATRATAGGRPVLGGSRVGWLGRRRRGASGGSARALSRWPTSARLRRVGAGLSDPRRRARTEDEQGTRARRPRRIRAQTAVCPWLFPRLSDPL